MRRTCASSLRAWVPKWRKPSRCPVTRDHLPTARPFRGVVVLGMGGSGIGGAVLADMVRATSPMPVCRRCRTKSFPGWVDADCLVVASSFSGNTEETLGGLERGGEARVRPSRL